MPEGRKAVKGNPKKISLRIMLNRRLTKAPEIWENMSMDSDQDDQTEAVEEPELELPNLTARQKTFVEAMAAGKRATEAYKEAYSTEGWTAGSIAVNASKTRNHPKVKAWLNAIYAAAVRGNVLTVEEHVAELDRLRELAVEDKQFTAAVRAEELKGKASGLYIERHEYDATITVRQDQAVTEFRRIAPYLKPDIALKMAKDLGVDPSEAGIDPAQLAKPIN